MKRLSPQPSSSWMSRPVLTSRLALVALLAGSLVSVTTLTACSRSDTAKSTAAAEAIGASECRACGMVVREQPAPRAQVVYANGTRSFFCSISDLVRYLEVPTSDGAPAQVYVEALTSEEDPQQVNTGEHRWIPAADAHYVLGVERPSVMGKPALVYASQEESAAAASRHKGRSVNYTELRRELIEGESSHHH